MGDAQLAADLANGYVEELNRVVTEDSSSSARRERIFLEERLKGVTKELNESSQALSQFSTKSKTIDIASQAKSMVDEGLKLESELIVARSNLAALRQSYSPDNARVKAAQAQIDELQREVNTMGGLPGEKGSNGGDSLYPTAAALPTLGLTYSNLERTVKEDEALWETLTKEYEMAKVQEAKEIPKIRVLDLARVPPRKSAPTRWLIMVIGTLLSFCFACAMVPLSEAWRRMDGEAEPKKLLLDMAASVANFRKGS
jgi:capsule polysaccharide export protein KpsE/RkpR